MRARVATLLGAMLLLVAACGGNGDSPTAADLMPDLDGYNVVEGEDLTDAIGRTAGGAALLSGNPLMAGAIIGVDEVIACYQEQGAVSGRLFSKADDLLAAGVIVIVDRNRLTSPETFLNCIRRPGPEAAQADIIQPCGKTYTLQRDNNEYYILYAASQPQVCQTFCAALEGCTP